MEDASAGDLLIFGVVLAARLLIPFAIPQYPLPAIIAAFLIDGFDQTIFQRFTDLDLDFYQSYDKALDIYYLTIAYVSTLRNWTNLFAFETDRFLFYYRLVGVVAFELTQVRALLLIFPNTFEYFFDFYEGVRLRWDPRRMTKRLVIGAAAFIWIVIKLPQEYIIHVAQVDTTDWIKENIFGVEPDASWDAAIANAPVVSIVLVVVVIGLVGAAWWILTYRLPSADHRLRFAADPIPADVLDRNRQLAEAGSSFRVNDPALIEKVVLISLVNVIFVQVLPGVEAGVLAVTIGVTFVIVANTLISIWLARHGLTWVSTAREFVALAAINTVLILLYAAVITGFEGSLDIGHALFFALLITLIITLYDRYRTVHLAKFGDGGATAPHRSLEGAW